MPLSDDQRALLRLLAQREHGYEDIAALKGKSVEEVRAEVNDALAELEVANESTPEPPPVELPPAEVEEPSETETEEESLAARRRRSIPKRTVRIQPTPPEPRLALPAGRRRLVLIAACALGLVAIMLGLIALIGGGGGSDSTTTAGAAESEIAAAENGKVTQAVLTAADGGDASGRAIFGRVGKEEIVLQVTAENLEPTDNGESYTVWLYRSPKLSLRVGSVAVGEGGRLGARFTIPAELLAYVASGAFDQIYVSRASNAAYQQEVARAKANKTLPRYTGETVLTGEITGPIAKAGNEGG
jgi:hypothetical protein